MGQATPVAEKLLGRPPDRIEPFHPKVGGDDSYSFRVWADGDAMLLKIKKEPGSPAGVYFHRRIADAGVPVPTLVAYDLSAGPDGQACALWEWIPGKPAAWGEGEPCPYDEREFGELLRRVHALGFEGPLGLIGDQPPQDSFTSHPDLGPIADTWSGFSTATRPRSATSTKAISHGERLGTWRRCQVVWRVS